MIKFQKKVRQLSLFMLCSLFCLNMAIWRWFRSPCSGLSYMVWRDPAYCFTRKSNMLYMLSHI